MGPQKEQKFVSYSHGDWRSKIRSQMSGSGEGTFQTVDFCLLTVSSHERKIANSGPLL